MNVFQKRIICLFNDSIFSFSYLKNEDDKFNFIFFSVFCTLLPRTFILCSIFLSPPFVYYSVLNTSNNNTIEMWPIKNLFKCQEPRPDANSTRLQKNNFKRYQFKYLIFFMIKCYFNSVRSPISITQSNL